MGNRWPWGRKARAERGWETVEAVAKAVRDTGEARIQIAEKLQQEGMSRHEAYTTVLNDFIERKRGAND